MSQRRPDARLRERSHLSRHRAGPAPEKPICGVEVGVQHQHLPERRRRCANREMALSPRAAPPRWGTAARQSKPVELKRLPGKKGLDVLLLAFVRVPKRPCSGQPFLPDAVDSSLLRDEWSSAVPSVSAFASG